MRPSLRKTRAAAAMLLAAAACFSAIAFAQRSGSELPETMSAPPLRGDMMPTARNDGRVGDPLAPALLLVPRTDPPQASIQAPPRPETPPPAAPAPVASARPAAAPETVRSAGDGAVGDLVAGVRNVPRARPSQTEIDGHVGDLLPDVRNVPAGRPSDRTSGGPRATTAGDAGDLLAYVAPLPSRRPATGGGRAIEAALAPGTARELPHVMSAAEKQCRARLAELGASFREHDPLADPSGCLVPFPVTLTSLGGGIDVAPNAVLNCPAAVAMAEYAQGIVAREARVRFGSPLTRVNHASAYVCRGRVGAGESKLSEHAFGNAIDIGSFELADGRRLDVRAYGPGERTERDFMRRVRGAACGPWKTVLGPGTNADHATHFHLDLAQRRRGGTYCR